MEGIQLSPGASDPSQDTADQTGEQPGNQSVPLLLRKIRTKLLSHTDVLTKSHDQVKPVVSTVMGSFEADRHTSMGV
jgi:hypothetical protein